MKYALGIDLGTTFSYVGIVLNNNPDVVADKKNKKDIPSMINFKKPKDGSEYEISCGNFAEMRQKSDPINTFYDTKRMLGRNFDDPKIEILKSRWPFKCEKSEDNKILLCLNECDRKYHPYEISGEILKCLAEIGNSRLPVEKRTNDVVITIPANFGYEQRQETLKAAEYAGLHVLTIINEPTAAGLAYGLQKSELKDSKVLIFDFGGGTLDVSLLNINGKEFTVKATDGDMFLGGRDFDENTANFLIEEMKLGDQYYTNFKKRAKLLEAVVESKKELSSSERSTIIINEDEYELKLPKFEEINSSLIEKILAPVERILKKSEIDKKDIDQILLVGGSSNMQFVSRKLTDFFGKEPFNGIDPIEAVVTGASLVANKMIQAEGDLEDLFILKEICSQSYGTSDADGTMSVFIKEGTQIPTSHSDRFRTIFYRQKKFTVDVYEGNNKYVSENNFLGDFSIRKIPKSENKVYFDVIFSIDEKGILTVSAKLLDGELKGQIQIDTKLDVKPLKYTDEEEEEEEEDDDCDDCDPEKRRILIFYENVRRFITFNMEDLIKLYSEKKIKKELIKVKEKKHGINERSSSLKKLAKKYDDRFKEYFKNHPGFNFHSFIAK